MRQYSNLKAIVFSQSSIKSIRNPAVFTLAAACKGTGVRPENRLDDFPGLPLEVSAFLAGFIEMKKKVFCFFPARSFFYDSIFCCSPVQGGSCDRNLAFNISWYLRSSVCYNEVFNTPVRTAPQ